MTPKERIAFLEYLPFIRHLEVYVPCDGYRPMSRRVSLDPIQKEYYRCKRNAYWKFRSLTSSYADDGIYCMSHLYVQFLHYPEDARIQRAWKKYKKEVLGDTRDQDTIS